MLSYIISREPARRVLDINDPRVFFSVYYDSSVDVNREVCSCRCYNIPLSLKMLLVYGVWCNGVWCMVNVQYSTSSFFQVTYAAMDNVGRCLDIYICVTPDIALRHNAKRIG